MNHTATYIDDILGKRTAKTSREKHPSDQITEFPIAEEFPARIPPGEYAVVYIGFDRAVVFRSRSAIFIHFRIVQGQFEGTVLNMNCTFPNGKMSHRFKYYQQWVIANGAPPRKNQPMRPDVFADKWFKVTVRTTKRKHPDGRVMDDAIQYSVVDSIIGRFTG